MLRLTLVVFLLLLGSSTNAAIIVGNLQGEVTLTEVFDYQCPHCQHMYSIIMALEAKNSNLRIRLLPVAIINQTSLLEATAAIVATQYPGTFSNLNRIFMERALLSSQDVTTILKELDIDTPNFVNAMHDSSTQAQLMEGINLLKKFTAGSVPLFLIYPSQHPGAQIILSGEQTVESLHGAIYDAEKIS